MTVENNRKAYRYNKQMREYEEMEFLSIVKGDTFVLCEPDGTPVTNRNHSVASVATADSEARPDGGVEHTGRTVPTTHRGGNP